MDTSFYYDGKSAKRQDVQVHFSDVGVDLSDSFGQRITFWSFADIFVVDELGDDQLRLGNRRFQDARLIVVGALNMPSIKEGIEQVKSKTPRKSTAYKFLFALPMAFALVILGFTFYGPSINPYLLHFVPIEIDKLIGDNAFEELGEEMVFCESEAGEGALQKILSRLAQASDDEFEFNVSVVRRKDVNAFAIPGGNIVVFSGLLREAQSAEEIAGVLAHEMAHVMKRHGIASLIKDLGISGLLMLTTGDTSRLLDFGNNILLMKMSREQESEADRVATEILRKAQISTKGFQSFFTRLAKSSEEHKGYSPIDFLETHPDSKLRADALRDPEGLQTKPVLNKRELIALKEYCKSTE